jgi:hypothetical protein
MTMRRIQVPPVPVSLLPVFSGLFSIAGIGGLQFRRLPVAGFYSHRVEEFRHGNTQYYV